MPPLDQMLSQMFLFGEVSCLYCVFLKKTMQQDQSLEGVFTLVATEAGEHDVLKSDSESLFFPGFNTILTLCNSDTEYI